LASGGAGESIGARVSRVLTPRLSVELSIDYARARFQITQTTATRRSAWNQRIQAVQ
jgi:hypothetical protein